MRERFHASLTRRTLLSGVGVAALVTATPLARAAMTWLWAGEKIAEGCLNGLGAGAITRAFRRLTGQDAVRLHEDSMRQIAQTMRQELHLGRVAEISGTVEALVRTLHEYYVAPEGLDRLEFATDHASLLVVQCEQLCERGADGEYWLPGLASFATAVSLKIAILQERAKRFRSRSESCNIEMERLRAKSFITRWRAQRETVLKRLVTEPEEVIWGVDGIGDVPPRVATRRLWVWTCEVEGRTTILDVNCGHQQLGCSQADELAEALSLVRRRRDNIDLERFRSTEDSANRMLRNWLSLSGCRTTPRAVTTTGQQHSENSPSLQPKQPAPKQVLSQDAEIKDMPKPVYPRRALAAEKTGRVNLRFSIDADGSVQDIAVQSVTPSGWGFEQAASEALRQARCTPKMIDGLPVKTSHVREFAFDLRE